DRRELHTDCPASDDEKLLRYPTQLEDLVSVAHIGIVKWNGAWTVWMRACCEENDIRAERLYCSVRPCDLHCAIRAEARAPLEICHLALGKVLGDDTLKQFAHLPGALGDGRQHDLRRRGNRDAVGGAIAEASQVHRGLA